MAPAVLEQLRLLTNLETAERKLLQIMLIGQPELREMLARPDLEQLAQRVVARYHLGPLARDETASYIRHRLSVAGAQARLPFEPAALRRIHELTGGVPRRINLLADRALLGAYAHQQPQVDRRTVEQAAREIFGGTGTRAGGPGRAAAIGAGAVIGAALVAAVAWAMWPREARHMPARPWPGATWRCAGVSPSARAMPAPPRRRCGWSATAVRPAGCPRCATWRGRAG